MASTKHIALALLALAAVVIAVIVYASRSTPQMGSDEAVFKTVDALFTAVTARDEKRLAECEERLRGYREQGKLPADAAERLDSIILKAKSGEWEPASRKLYDFMKEQRREK